MDDSFSIAGLSSLGKDSYILLLNNRPVKIVSIEPTGEDGFDSIVTGIDLINDEELCETFQSDQDVWVPEVSVIEYVVVSEAPVSK